MSYALIPDFMTPAAALPLRVEQRVPFHADPILAAIARHRAAFDAYQVAPEGAESIAASDDYEAASEAIITTACATRFGALALLTHLRWWIAEETDFAAGHQPAYGIAQARVADLSLFLGTNPPPVAIGTALPMGRLPVSSQLRAGVLADRLGEAVAALVLIAGGSVLTGIMSLL